MRDDSTAFDWAVHSGDLPTMELLAGHPRVDVAAMNRFGCASVCEIPQGRAAVRIARSHL